MRKIAPLFYLLLCSYPLYPALSSYTFTSSSGSYSSISGGTQLWSTTFDDAVSSAITIPSFTIDGTAYTTIYVSTNGFITFGSAPTTTNYTPLSSSEGYSIAISAFGLNVTQSASGSPEVKYEDLTSSSEFVIQWKDIRRSGIADQISCQIRLNYATNSIVIIYGGTITAGNNTTYPQVGIRGSSNSTYINRTTTTDWSATTAGGANTSTCKYTSTVGGIYPTTGQTYTYDHPVTSIGYTFSSSSASYTAITGGTALYSTTFDDGVSSAISIPTFAFNCSNYTSLYVSTNGFITFGSAPASTNYTPLYSTETYSYCIAAFACNLNNAGSGTPEIRYETVTTSKEFVIQWQDVKRAGASGELISFQLRLNYETNTIKIVYGGTITPANYPTYYPQVGLRGGNNYTFENRTTSSNWSATTAGTYNNATLTYNSTGSIKPASGQTYILESPCTVSNGPGGVGNISPANGSLRLWLEGNDLDGDGDYTDNPSNGSSVTTWYDKSGRAFDLTQGTAGFRPNYNSSGTYSGIEFVSTTRMFLQNGAATYLNPFSVFYVIYGTDAGVASNNIADDKVCAFKYEQFSNTGVTGYSKWLVGDYNTGTSTPYGSNALISFHKTGSSSNMTINTGSSSNTISVGSTSSAAPYYFLGSINTLQAGINSNMMIMEVVAHDVKLNSFEIKAIENYLSAKYGGLSIPSDLYTMDNAGNGDFDYDISGIGQDDASNSISDTKGTGILRVNNASSLGNGDALFWGHNNGALAANESSDVPSGVQKRLSRTWRVSHTGSIGTVDLTFDLSSLGSITSSDLRLIIDTDNDGVFTDETSGGGGVISSLTDLGGNLYKFSGITLSDSRRFSLGTINAAQSPLPVELLFFTEICKEDGIHLNWATHSETHNHFFLIEHSNDGFYWNKITEIMGKGNSTTTSNYEYVDKAIDLQEGYFRLSQTDFDGKTTIYPVIATRCDNEVTDILIYPNPFSEQLQLIVQQKEAENYHIRLYSLEGTLVFEQHALPIPAEQNQVITLTPANLAGGTYMLEISNGIKNYHKKVVKQ